ncbi:NAD(P)-dependent oxidoreductase [Agromyces soli]|uniref:Hydroxyacid dehydrogenase n=1 Tax=Agromyces soli TaxID=659012 RepID=A0ABY4AV95_9MICO|nr:NAD(P)-dependent oxidoreductase [Agromyces soli]UOE27100.1 hypothetical protein MTP13_04775 [Agromyces soli]
MPTSPRILVIGDSYMSAEVFADALDGRVDAVELRTMTPTDAPSWSLDALHEYEGDPAEVDAFIDGHEVLVVHGAPITRRVLEQNPSVRMIGCARGGPVNIDLDAAAELGVTVATTPGKNAEAVADLTIGFIITAFRNLRPALQDVDAAAAEGRAIAESAFEGARWFGSELRGARLGLIGLGHVARLVAARARALGMTVTAYDPFVADAVEGVTLAPSLEALLPEVDVLSIHARATADNRHLVGETQLGLLPEGAVLVNTARESLVDEAALLAALRSGQLRAAAMDVCEPDGPWRELVALPQVQLTPHIGGATFETLARGARMVVDRVVEHLEQREPVDAEERAS